jgi:hypothetical protein
MRGSSENMVEEASLKVLPSEENAINVFLFFLGWNKAGYGIVKDV